MIIVLGNYNLNSPITITIATDDTATIYVDGQYKAVTISHIPININVKASSRVIAVVVYNMGQSGGLIAQISTGIVSDRSWKCTDKEPATQ